MDWLSIFDPDSKDTSFATPPPALPQVMGTHEQRVNTYLARADAGKSIFSADEDATDHDRLGVPGQPRTGQGRDKPPCGLMERELAAEELDKHATTWQQDLQKFRSQRAIPFPERSTA